AHTDEDKHMISAVQDVKESFGLDKVPGELLADGMMSTGENLARCEELEIDFYSPIKLGCKDNPADRQDPRQPVPEADWDRLPASTTKRDGKKIKRFNKNAFIYEPDEDCYWCPAGEKLAYQHQTSQMENGRRRIFYRYQSSAESCQGCPLASRCLGAKSKTRGVSHGEHESKRRNHAEKMKSSESQAKYARRRSPGERPFAVIKAKYGARQFFSRGLQRVRNEWLWLVSAFNLERLLSLQASGPDPPRRR
ncbi:transposase, partial [Rhodopirellula sp. JC639]|uniref:transposase n=1 Tax=Stieleria mannarensis TaxID=2755585 RepID=UPI001C721E06